MLEKNDEQSVLKRCKFGVAKLRPTNCLKFGFGSVLASIWEGFGTVWGFSQVLWGASWPLFGCSRSSFVRESVQDGLQEPFWIDFGSILEGFWEGLGAVGEGFERILGAFEQKFARIWRILGLSLHLDPDAGP